MIPGSRQVRRAVFGAALALLFALPVSAEPVTVFGPKQYTRGHGQPIWVTDGFTVANPGSSYTLRIQNGGNGQFDKVTSATVKLNGTVILDEDDFGHNQTLIQRPVTLASSNQIAVIVRGKPGSAFLLDVFGQATDTDTTPPVITATAAPAANAAGWNNTNVTVTFTCSDAGSGIATCPPPVTVSAEGAGQVVQGTATDRAGNSASTSVSLNIDKSPPSLTAVASPPPNAAGWNNTDVTVSFEATDALSGVVEVTDPQSVVGEGSMIAVEGTARDLAGNTAVLSAHVSIDKSPPDVSFTAPEDGTVRRVPQVEVQGAASDSSGIASLMVNGQTLEPGSSFSLVVPLERGPQVILARATDKAGNEGAATIQVAYQPLPVVKITSPESLAAFGTSPITVNGTIDDAQATVLVGLEQVPAVVSGGNFVAEGVHLQEGGNVVTAVATSPSGDSSTDSVTLILDTTAPRVLIDSPPNGSVTTEETITVTGRVNDVVIGTINAGQAQVFVNDVPAAVSNRTFIASGIALVLGTNTITARVRDAVGNMDEQGVTVIREAPTGPRIAALSGDSQTAGIGETLPQPLVVSLTDGEGHPVAGSPVAFRVAANNGSLLDADGTSARGLALTTDALGQAHVRFVLGSRAGVGNNRVEATSPGVIGAAVFVASATNHLATRVHVDSGDGQKGAVGHPLPRPLVVVVTDDGHNRLAGVPVTFSVEEGDGDFQGGTSFTVETDTDGRALAVLTLGPLAGIENNLVTASVEGLASLAAAFHASALEPGDPAETRISGVVLDNSDNPIPGVTLRIRGTALAVRADPQGQFALTGVPVGDVHLMVDGSTAETLGTWPDLEFELVTVPGADNTLGMPIYLLPLDTAHGIFVDETHGDTLTLPDVPGFSLTVAPNSATFPDGSRHGTITVTPVHSDKVPMVPNFGQQPRFIVTVQPPGVRFDPPAKITHPNVDGLAPGEITELYSFDHDMGSFVATGTATVSEDGMVLVSDPGTGILKGGWHCGGNPPAGGAPFCCPDCQTCNHDKRKCEEDKTQKGQPCTGKKNPNFNPTVTRDYTFTAGGVTQPTTVKITVDPSCYGKCDGGKCKTKSDRWGGQQLVDAAEQALDKALGNCQGPLTQLKMQLGLSNRDITITCDDTDKEDCAHNIGDTGIVFSVLNKNDTIPWPPGVILSTRPTGTSCPDVATTVRHELQHNAGDRHMCKTGPCSGDSFADIDCPRDVVYPCDRACFNDKRCTNGICP